MQDEDADSSQDTTGLESALARVDRAVEASGKAVTSLAHELKRARAVAAAYDIDEVDMRASGAYAKELLAAQQLLELVGLNPEHYNRYTNMIDTSRFLASIYMAAAANDYSYHLNSTNGSNAYSPPPPPHPIRDRAGA